jgi:hypothetical protein
MVPLLLTVVASVGSVDNNNVSSQDKQQTTGSANSNNKNVLWNIEHGAPEEEDEYFEDGMK